MNEEVINYLVNRINYYEQIIRLESERKKFSDEFMSKFIWGLNNSRRELIGLFEECSVGDVNFKVKDFIFENGVLFEC